MLVYENRTPNETLKKLSDRECRVCVVSRHFVSVRTFDVMFDHTFLNSQITGSDIRPYKVGGQTGDCIWANMGHFNLPQGFVCVNVRRTQLRKESTVLVINIIMHYIELLLQPPKKFLNVKRTCLCVYYTQYGKVYDGRASLCQLSARILSIVNITHCWSQTIRSDMRCPIN